MQLWVVAIGAAVAEFWWVAPAAAGAGAAGLLGVRRSRSTRARRLGVASARLELQQARAESQGARAAARVAQAEVSRAEAERAAGRASAEDVRTARRALDAAQRTRAASTATIRVARARIGAERATVPARGTDTAHLPLARLMAAHDANAARWMAYETDAARHLAFPAMSDVRVPATAEFLRLEAVARERRPATATARVTPAEFAAYRAAVDDARRAFEAAEQEAWRLAGHRPDDAPPPPPSIGQRWTIAATEAITRSADGLARAAESAASALDSHRGGRRRTGDAGQDAAPRRPIWPVPSRTEHRDDDARP
ncbi:MULTISPECIES: hypothetical protein [unclassified Microbacterium]|uniref:hypothetical protein n=1 Tax=unclassified Microbacterium TaxID=2609290 RepID=UPI00386BC6A7